MKVSNDTGSSLIHHQPGPQYAIRENIDCPGILFHFNHRWKDSEINVERLLPGIYILNVNYQYKCKFVKM